MVSLLANPKLEVTEISPPSMGNGTEAIASRRRSAWLQAIRAACGRAGRQRPLVVLSHVPPAGYGDMPGSNYHRGFRGYRWFLRRARPALWLHGHVHPAAADAAVVDADGTPVVNVTGATLLDLDPSATEVRPGSLASRSVAPAAGRST